MEKKNREYDPNSHSDVINVKEEDDVGEAAECGIGRFKVAALGVCANMAAFTGFYSINVLLTSTLTNYVNSQVTTLERHFGFNSSQTGLIMAANDIGFLAVVLLISYLAAKVHIPRALASMSILFGVSGVMCALPHFMFGGPSPPSADVTLDNGTSLRSSTSFTGQVCGGINGTSSDCAANVTTTGDVDVLRPGNEARANSGIALVIIVVGMVLQGVAKTPRSSFISVYVDNNVNKTNTGFYLGIIITFAVLGPGLAFALGGVFSRIYVTLEETNLHFRHPKWIGAWWLGYITFGVAACIFSVPICFFPRQIKGGKRSKNLSTKMDPVSAPKMVSNFLKGWLGTMWRLLTNPVYICVLMSSCFIMFTVSGGQSFTPKYIENQFSFDIWKANFAMAGMMLCIACTGTFVGGYLTKRLKMDKDRSLKFVLTCQTIATVFIGLMMVSKCDQPLLYNSPGPRASEETTLPGCHDNCACDDDDYFPVCGDDGRSFFSPCHAGCQGNVGTAYVNCSCIAGGRAVAGLCEYGCSMVYLYIVSFCFTAFFSTLALVPRVVVLLRAVEERDKSLAVGFHAFMTSVTGWMLGPICFGKLIDGICIQWEKSCSGDGYCRLYDNEDFRLKLYGSQIAIRSAGVLFMAIAFLIARATRKPDKEKKGENSVELKEALTTAETEGGTKKDQEKTSEEDKSQKKMCDKV